MFLVGQFPLADVRPFLARTTHRLAVPDWPLVSPGEEFVRSFGMVRRRRRGGVGAWPGEDVYCDASHALRFQNQLGKARLGPKSVGFRPYCLFRRFFAFGPLGRIDIGFRNHPAAPPLADLEGRQLVALVEGILKLPVHLPTRDSSSAESCSLLNVGPAFARSYLQATTRNRCAEPPESWWCASGSPLLLIEHQAEEVTTLPPHARTPRILEEDGISLAHVAMELRGRPVGVWFLGYRQNASRDVRRRLRIHLFRLHAERECLRQTLRAIRRHPREFNLEPHTEAFDALQKYLNDAIGLLEKKRAYGFDQSEILAAAWESQHQVGPGERASLLAALTKARRNILRKVERFTAERPEQARIVNVYQHSGTVNVHDETIEEQIMSKITMGDNASIAGDFTVVTAEKIENSFNKAASSSVPDELKKNLQNLAQAVAEMSKHLPPDKAEEAARDLETLTEEATSEKPRRKWYELSAEGLVEAAKAVGEAAAPVIKTVKAIVALLAV